MEENERERLQTSFESPQEDLESSPSVSQSLDFSFEDSSTLSMTSSIHSSVRDTEEDLAKQKLLAQFSPGELCFTLSVHFMRSLVIRALNSVWYLEPFNSRYHI